MFCRYCHNSVPGGILRCPRCGSPLGDPAFPPPAQARAAAALPSGASLRVRLVMTASGLAILLVFALILADRHETVRNDQIVDAAVSQIYFTSRTGAWHNAGPHSGEEIARDIAVWRERYRQYDSRLIFAAPDRVKVSFWNHGVKMGEQDLEYCALGWIPPLARRPRPVPHHASPVPPEKS